MKSSSVLALRLGSSALLKASCAPSLPVLRQYRMSAAFGGAVATSCATVRRFEVQHLLRRRWIEVVKSSSLRNLLLVSDDFQNYRPHLNFHDKKSLCGWEGSTHAGRAYGRDAGQDPRGVGGHHGEQGLCRLSYSRGCGGCRCFAWSDDTPLSFQGRPGGGLGRACVREISRTGSKAGSRLRLGGRGDRRTDLRQSRVFLQRTLSHSFGSGDSRTHGQCAAGWSSSCIGYLSLVGRRELVECALGSRNPCVRRRGPTLAHAEHRAWTSRSEALAGRSQSVQSTIQVVERNGDCLPRQLAEGLVRRKRTAQEATNVIKLIGGVPLSLFDAWVEKITQPQLRRVS